MADVNLITANAAATATITNRYDVNLDGRVDSTDRSLASLNRTTSSTALALLSIAAPAAAALEPASSGLRIMGFRDPDQPRARAAAFKGIGLSLMMSSGPGLLVGSGRPAVAFKRLA